MKERTFKIQTYTGTKEVKGVPVKIKGINGYSFFLHKSIDSNSSISISEKSTGGQICQGYSKDMAMQKAIDLAKKHKQRGFDKKIKELLKQINDPFEKAIRESGITLIETEKSDLKRALKKYCKLPKYI